MAAYARDADGSTCIVTCSDKMASNDAYGAEILHKVHVLSPDAVSLYADSPARAKELALLYQEYLAANPLRPAQLVAQLETPLITLKRRLVGSYIGRRFGLSYDEFMQDAALREKYLTVIAAHGLRVQLIVAGFIDERPFLLQTAQSDDRDDLPRLEWVEHFAVIGSGQWVAEPSLYMREQDKNRTLEKTLYQLYEAKRQAEISPSVGKEITRMFVIRPRRSSDNLSIQVITPKGEHELQELYRTHGPKAVPNRPSLTPSAFQTARFPSP